MNNSKYAQEMPLFRQLRNFLNFVCGDAPPPLSSIEDELLIMSHIITVQNKLYGDQI